MRFLCPQCRTVLSGNPGVEIECSLCGEKVTAPANHFHTNAVIGDFAIVRELGRGGVGVIYLARQISLDRPVALKILQAKFAEDPEFVESFVREARVAAKLSHPNIVQAYAVGEEDGLFYFAMEYIDGQTMKQVLKKEGKIDPRRAAEIIREVADALDCAWTERKLVHQDIKPDNIMLTRRGAAKLADLGLARLAGSDTGMNDDDDEVMGTPQYISPEQLTGMPTDVRSDIYSLGATFFHFVTGRFPYVGRDGNEIARQHVEGTLTPPRQLNPAVPEEINRIIVKMMAKDIKLRYQSAAELRDDLRRFLEGSGSGKIPKLTIPSSSTTFVPKLTVPATATTFTPTLNAPALAVPVVPTLTPPVETTMVSVAEEAGSAVPEVPEVMAVPEVPAVPEVMAVPEVPAVPEVSAPPAEAETPVETPAETPEPEKPAETPEPEKPAEPAKPEEPAKPAEPLKVAEPAVKKVFFTKRKIRVTLLILISLLVVVGGIGGGLFWVIRANRVPEKFRPVETKLLALLHWERQDGKLVRLAPATPEPQQSAPAPVEPVKPRVVLPPPPPKPVTRSAYLDGVSELLDEVRDRIPEERFLEHADAFFVRFGQPRTPEELAAQRRLAAVFGRVDERLRVSPERRRARQAEMAAIDARRDAAERRRREEAELAERRRKASEDAAAEARRVAAEAAEQERINRETDQASMERLQTALNEIRTRVNVAFIRAVRSGDAAIWTAVAEAENSRLQQIFTANAKEKALKDALANDIRQLGEEWKNMTPCRELFADPARLGQIQIELAGGELVRVLRFEDGKLITSPDGKRTVALDMNDAASRHAFTRRAERKFKIRSTEYYLLLLHGNYSAAMKLKNQPSPFLRQHLPALLTAYFGSLSDAERAKLEPLYGSMKEFKQEAR